LRLPGTSDGRARPDHGFACLFTIQCHANPFANRGGRFERAEMFVQSPLERALFLQALAACRASGNMFLRDPEFVVSQLAVGMRRKVMLYVSAAIHPISF